MQLPERIDTVYEFARKVYEHRQQNKNCLRGGCLLLSCAATIPAGRFNRQIPFEQMAELVIERRNQKQGKELPFFIDLLSNGSCQLVGPWEILQDQQDNGAIVIEEAASHPNETFKEIIEDEEKPIYEGKEVSGLVIVQAYKNRPIGHIYAIIPDEIVFDTHEENTVEDERFHLFVDTAWTEHGPFKDSVNFLTAKDCLQYAFLPDPNGEIPKLHFYFVLANKSP